jgi:DNA-binding beta-propeller fold protein YncE
LFVTLPEERSMAVIDPLTLAESGERVRLQAAAHGICLAPGGDRLYVTDSSADLVSFVEL